MIFSNEVFLGGDRMYAFVLFVLQEVGGSDRTAPCSVYGERFTESEGLWGHVCTVSLWAV